MGDTTQSSFLDVGVLQPAAMKNPEDLVYIPALPGRRWWENNITGIRFVTEDGTQTAFSIESTMMMTDTGTSCNYIPAMYYQSFVEVLITYLPEEY